MTEEPVFFQYIDPTMCAYHRYKTDENGHGKSQIEQVSIDGKHWMNARGICAHPREEACRPCPMCGQ